MSHRSLASIAALAAVVLIVLLAQTPATGQAQSPAKAAGTWTAPRTPDGKPDLHGIWADFTLTPFERPKGVSKEFYTDQELTALAMRARDGSVGEDGELGASRPQAVRYDLELYGFDAAKLRYSSNRTSLVIGPEGVVPPMLPAARERNAERAARDKG